MSNIDTQVLEQDEQLDARADDANVRYSDVVELKPADRADCHSTVQALIEVRLDGRALLLCGHCYEYKHKAWLEEIGAEVVQDVRHTLNTTPSPSASI